MKGPEFSRAWNSSHTLEEFLRLSGMKKRPAVVLASYYRALGVPLQMFARKHKGMTVDVKAMIKAAEEGAAKRLRGK